MVIILSNKKRLTFLFKMCIRLNVIYWWKWKPKTPDNSSILSCSFFPTLYRESFPHLTCVVHKAWWCFDGSVSRCSIVCEMLLWCMCPCKACCRETAYQIHITLCWCLLTGSASCEKLFKLSFVSQWPWVGGWQYFHMLHLEDREAIMNWWHH